jgi:hypothetical protein
MSAGCGVGAPCHLDVCAGQIADIAEKLEQVGCSSGMFVELCVVSSGVLQADSQQNAGWAATAPHVTRLLHCLLNIPT